MPCSLSNDSQACLDICFDVQAVRVACLAACPAECPAVCPAACPTWAEPGHQQVALPAALAPRLRRSTKQKQSLCNCFCSTASMRVFVALWHVQTTWPAKVQCVPAMQ